MLRIATALGALALVSGCAMTPMAPAAAVADLAPTGKLRAAINFGNPVLASKAPSSGEPLGVSVDLARELARAYDPYPTRAVKQATLVRVPTSQAVSDTLVARDLDVAAGVRQQLESDARRVGGVRVLDGRFMAIEQAMGTPRARAAGAAYLQTFVEEMKASGFVARALARHGIDGAIVAPPDGAP